MASVIDTLRIAAALRREVPGVAAPFPGDGLLVILDQYDPGPAEVTGAAVGRFDFIRPFRARSRIRPLVVA